jgi:FkbM family methyltransferase
MILAGGVWAMMRFLKMDEFIALKTDYNSILRKVMPRARAYKHEQFEHQVTPTMKMVLDRRDYSQWRVFSGKLRINQRIFEYIQVKPYSFTMIDVGANVGGFATLFSQEIDVEHYNVHLFEPNPLIARTLGENMGRLGRSHIPSNPYVNFQALGDNVGRQPMKINENHSGVSTLGKTKRPFTKIVEVDVTTLDHYVTEKKVDQIDMIKIDAEAYEPAILKGAMETITKMKPALYFEYSRDWFDNFSPKYISTLFTYLTSLGYLFLREGSDGKMHYFVINEKTLLEFRHLNILGLIRYEFRDRP